MGWFDSHEESYNEYNVMSNPFVIALLTEVTHPEHAS